MIRRILFLALLALHAGAAVAQAQPITVFAAASLTDALGDVAQAWAKRGHPPIRTSYAASSTLARQIEQGADANIFASADEQWMDYLAGRGLIVPGTRRDLLSNQLVLIVPANAPKQVSIGSGLDLAALLGPAGRLAMGDPAHVPAGLYAKQALEKLGWWEAVAPRLARTDDVRGALLLVERGEAPAGIVYKTDAMISKAVMIAGVFPPGSHDPIAYPFAMIRGHETPEARSLLDFLSGPEAKAIFAKRGFEVE